MIRHPTNYNGGGVDAHELKTGELYRITMWYPSGDDPSVPATETTTDHKDFIWRCMQPPRNPRSMALFGVAHPPGNENLRKYVRAEQINKWKEISKDVNIFSGLKGKQYRKVVITPLDPVEVISIFL